MIIIIFNTCIKLIISSSADLQRVCINIIVIMMVFVLFLQIKYDHQSWLINLPIHIHIYDIHILYISYIILYHGHHHLHHHDIHQPSRPAACLHWKSCSRSSPLQQVLKQPKWVLGRFGAMSSWRLLADCKSLPINTSLGGMSRRFQWFSEESCGT